MKRREFVGALGGTALLSLRGTAADSPPDVWIDCNVTTGTWPFRQTVGSSTEGLAKKLSGLGVTQAWTGSFHGLFRNDLRAANAELSESCLRLTNSILKPVATINPSLPDWREDVRFCYESLSMSMIRLYPNYHGYRLDDPCFGELLHLANDRKLFVQIVVQIEDDRTQSPRMQVPPVDLGPLKEQLMQATATRIMVLNASRAQLEPIIELPQVAFDIARIESVGGLEKLLSEVSHERVVFGSHAPYFYWEAARYKLQESELLDRQLDSIVHSSAEKWMKG